MTSDTGSTPDVVADALAGPPAAAAATGKARRVCVPSPQAVERAARIRRSLPAAFMALLFGLHLLAGARLVPHLFAFPTELALMYSLGFFAVALVAALRSVLDPGLLPCRSLAATTAPDSAAQRLFVAQKRAFGLMSYFPALGARAPGADAEPDATDPICPTCDLWRPLRAGHCRETGRCIARFDHYCAWVGAPIGAGNHRVFVVFVLALVVHFGLALRLLLALIGVGDGRPAHAPATIASVFSVDGLVFLVCAAGVLFGFVFTLLISFEQLRNVARDATVREVIKKRLGGGPGQSSEWADRHSAQRNHRVRNCLRFWLRGE